MQLAGRRSARLATKAVGALQAGDPGRPPGIPTAAVDSSNKRASVELSPSLGHDGTTPRFMPAQGGAGEARAVKKRHAHASLGDTEAKGRPSKLRRCGSSVRELVAASEEVPSLKPPAHKTSEGIATEESSRKVGSNPFSNPWRRIVDVNGFKTEVYGAHSLVPEKASMRVVILPGNPGQAGYYLPLICHMHDALAGQAEVLCVSHKGHGIDCSSTQAFSLTEQIRHKVDFLKEHCMGEGEPPVVLLGHSIGAFMAFHAAAAIETSDGLKSNSAQGGATTDKAKKGTVARPPRLRRNGLGAVHGQSSHKAGKKDKAPKQSITKVIGAFPFLAVDSKTRFGRQGFLRMVTSFPGVFAAVGSALGAVSSSWRQRVIQLLGGQELQEHAVDSTDLVMRYWSCYNAFYLAKTEFQDLAAPPEWDLIERFGSRAAMILCPNDIWAPDWQMQEMQRRLPDLKVIFDKSMVHGFCVSDQLSERMAGHVASLVAATSRKGEPQSAPLRPI